MATSTLFGKEIVLILVLVEDGLRAVRRCMYDKVTGESLNPCSCGRWSQSSCIREEHRKLPSSVLILVLVEDGLREYEHLIKNNYV